MRKRRVLVLNSYPDPPLSEILYPPLAVGGYLSRHRHYLLNPTNSSLLKLLRTVLTTNNFKFDNKDFLQVGGTAMGTKLAPSFAKLFMGYLKTIYIFVLPLLWKMFIDDIFFIWIHGEDELLTFVQHLNDCHQTIKFTLETSLKTVNFLDILIIKRPDGTLATDLYCKPIQTVYLSTVQSQPGVKTYTKLIWPNIHTLPTTYLNLRHYPLSYKVKICA